MAVHPAKRPLADRKAETASRRTSCLSGFVTPDHATLPDLLGIVVTVGAVAAGSAHVIWPHLKIGSVTIALIVVALVPWLGGLVEDIALPAGFKVSVRKIEKRPRQRRRLRYRRL